MSKTNNNSIKSGNNKKNKTTDLKAIDFIQTGNAINTDKYRAVIKINYDLPEKYKDVFTERQLKKGKKDKWGNDGDLIEYSYQYITGFRLMDSLEEVVIPSDCKYLGNAFDRERYYEGAFEDCKNLKTVIINPDSELEVVYNLCFRNCIKLETIDFTNCKKLDTIYDRAFSGCDKLKKIYMNYNSFVDCFGGYTDRHKFSVVDRTAKTVVIVSGKVHMLNGDEHILENIELPLWQVNPDRKTYAIKRIPPNLNELFYKQYREELNLKSPKHFSLLAPTAGLEGSGEIISLTKEDYDNGDLSDAAIREQNTKQWSEVEYKILAQGTRPKEDKSQKSSHVDLSKMVLKFKDIPETPTPARNPKRAISLPTKSKLKMTKKASRTKSLPTNLSGTNKAPIPKSRPTQVNKTKKTSRTKSLN